jgi:hypothetical protein
VKIYYAHHLWKYDTEIERYELDLIKRTFPDAEIINPNGDISHDSENEESIMSDCLWAVGCCDCLVFSSMNGVVGKGVHDEVSYAAEVSKPIYYLNENQICKVKAVWFSVIKCGSRRVYALVRTEE